MNHITLFSNGIGHFRRTYKIQANKPEKVSIPFQKEHVSDVLASLGVFGNVCLDSPPSFTPINSDTTTLVIDPLSAMKSLLVALRGTSVTVSQRYGQQNATLIGLESQKISCGKNIITQDYVVLTSGGSITKVVLSEVSSINFNDETIQTEIDKALKIAFEKIKPDNTFLDLVLSSTTDEEAIVQYTVPVAAWKMVYNIRQKEGKYSLTGTAIIDNASSEDWDEFIISVVTGNPISFSTDLAEVKVPKRNKVNLVDQVVKPEETFESYREVSAKGFRHNATTTLANSASFGMSEASGGSSSATVEAKDIGDFCVFTAKTPISIASKKSALVPMFTVPLTKAGSVLLYKEQDHSRRPWRAIKFKNETSYSLGKGKVVVYQEDVFAGECVLEAAKPNENRMLPHCLENGVRVKKDTKPQQNKTSSIKLSDGIFYQEVIHTSVTTYTIDNKKTEEFKFLLEHMATLDHAEYKYSGIEIKETEKLSNGVRLYFVLPVGKVSLTVTETWVEATHFAIVGQFGWLQTQINNIGGSLAADKNIQAVFAIQQKIDSIKEQIKESQSHKTDVTEQAKRVRENLQATKDEQASKLRANWVSDLDETEKEIRKIDKEILPGLNNSLKSLIAKLEESLKVLTVLWKS